jgi:alpha-methylacyl-CoA racemase
MVRSGSDPGTTGAGRRQVEMSGPLEGLRVIEVVGIGPGPFAAMMLADMGAEVLRIDRHDSATAERDVERPRDLLGRGRRSVGIDLKHPDGVGALLELVEQADCLIEGFRPGVAERLGIGPEECMSRNPRLVYGRMTGWGQEGPYAQAAGHDINYIALAGALEPIGRSGERPLPPLNLVGDFGGGGMLLAFGVVCAVLEARQSGRGQVVDAAMVDGAAVLMTFIRGLKYMGLWEGERGTNLLDTGAPFYEVYETADGGYVSVGAIEPQFYAELVRLSGFDTEEFPAQMDRSQWPAMKERMAQLFRLKSRDEWCEIMEGSDACFAPVLSMDEAPLHRHNRARTSFVEVEGVVQAAPAPRFSRTPARISGPPPRPGQHTDDALVDWGFSPEHVAKLRSDGAVA